jgi:hypothetical protein
MAQDPKAPPPVLTSVGIIGPSIRDASIVGLEAWFVVYRKHDGRAFMTHHFTSQDARGEMDLRSTDPEVDAAALWTGQCIKTWRSDPSSG